MLVNNRIPAFCGTCSDLYRRLSDRQAFKNRRPNKGMTKEKSQMPMSTAGLVRYFEDSKEAPKIKPEYVIIFSAALIVLEVALRFM